jgi:hypothetical protein
MTIARTHYGTCRDVIIGVRYCRKMVSMILSETNMEESDVQKTDPSPGGNIHHATKGVPGHPLDATRRDPFLSQNMYCCIQPTLSGSMQIVFY